VHSIWFDVHTFILAVFARIKLRQPTFFYFCAVRTASSILICNSLKVCIPVLASMPMGASSSTSELLPSMMDPDIEILDREVDAKWLDWLDEQSMCQEIQRNTCWWD
jgi:hypothetical protein